MFNFDLRETLLMLPAILFSLSLHEFCHAYAAVRLGDPTPANQGRLTLNPIAHIDPIGFLLLLFAGFGWAKPVMINPLNFRNPRRDDIIVSVAGPASNMVTAAVFAVIMKVVIKLGIITLGPYGEVFYEILNYFVWINLILAFFNMIPIPPLDGSHILFAILPQRFERWKENFFRVGSILLIVIIMIENRTDLDILPIGKMAATVYKGFFHVLHIE